MGEGGRDEEVASSKTSQIEDSGKGKVLYLNCTERFEVTIENSGLNGIQTHNLYDTCAVLYQLSYQARELVTLQQVQALARDFV